MADNNCFDVEEARTLISDARYEIESFIGQGAMACVYKVREIGTPNVYALKLLREEYRSRSQFLDFFEREANHMRDLQYPNIVRFYKFVREERSAYILMDYVEGKPLTHYIRESRQTGEPVDLAKIVRIMAQIARSLSYLHREGYIHRDVKPGNILLVGEDEKAFLTDLGIVGANMADEPALRGAGTPSYMPYEQQTSVQVDHTVDSYAFAVMLYELFTGEKPFAPPTGLSFKEARKAILELHRKAPIPRLSEKREDIPEEIDAIFEQALAKNPEERYLDVLDFAQDIHEHLLPQLPPDLQDFENIQAQEMTRSAQAQAPEEKINRREYRILMIGGVALLLIAIGVIVGIYWNTRNEQNTSVEIAEATAEITEQIMLTNTATASPTVTATVTQTPTPTITPSPTVPPSETPFLYDVERLSLADGVNAIGYGEDLSDAVTYIASVRDGFVPLQAGNDINGFRVELSLNSESLAENQQSGIAFRIQDEDNYLLFSVDTARSQWQLLAIVAGEQSILQEDTMIASIPVDIVVSGVNEFIRIDYNNDIIEQTYTDFENGSVALWFSPAQVMGIDVQNLQFDLIGDGTDLAGQVNEINVQSLSPYYFILEDVSALQATVNVTTVDCTRFVDLYHRLEHHRNNNNIAAFADDLELASLIIASPCQGDPENTALEFSLSDINRWLADIDELIAEIESTTTND